VEGTAASRQHPISLSPRSLALSFFASLAASALRTLMEGATCHMMKDREKESTRSSPSRLCVLAKFFEVGGKFFFRQSCGTSSSPWTDIIIVNHHHWANII